MHHTKINAEGTSEKLIGFQIDERGIPRSGYLLFDTDEIPLASASEPSLPPQQRHRFGLCKTDYSKRTKISVKIRKTPATVVNLPCKTFEAFKQMKRILILGASGFIGNTLTRS